MVPITITFTVSSMEWKIHEISDVQKETTDQDYHSNPFRAVNFPLDAEGVMRCPNGKAFTFLYRKHIYGNQYGRQEEVYQCEDCTGCPYADKCKKTDKTELSA